ncbi:MAG TPA: CHAT domain-containing protein, partial [Trebonia sp.]
VACHAGPLPAYQHQSSQLNHGFALWDDDLTIADLAAQPKRHGGLAFLSACQTASPNAGHRDEALHLAGAMQFLGYSHVVATMWSIADRPAPQAAGTFYETLAKRGPDHAAHALRSAVLKLRDEDPTNPFIWAPYVHIGR